MLLLFNEATATHYRAGEISYSWVSGMTYTITVNTYTDPLSGANVQTPNITIDFDDGSILTVPRSVPQILFPNDNHMAKNIYITTHTFPSEGSYYISVTDQNRVDGIVNINMGNTLNLAFYVESLLIIDNAMSRNNSPILNVPPIDQICGGFIYTHNPGAYDPDGDSLVYELIAPKRGKLNDVPNFVDLRTNIYATISFTINRYTGQIVWNTTPYQGYPNMPKGLPAIFNIAIQISQFRNGTFFGYVVRDMQIKVNDCNNHPPVLDPLPAVCVQAGNLVQYGISASDLDTPQLITLEGFGFPFSYSKYRAYLTPSIPANYKYVSAPFTWQTSCSDIRYESYPVVFKATDNFYIPSSYEQSTTIKVIGPAPKNLKIKQVGDGFNISWDKDICGLATQYKIYKRIDSSHWNPQICSTGVDPTAKFTLLRSVTVNNSPNDTFIYDNNSGSGLTPLIDYCYRVVAVYPSRYPNGNIFYGKSAESYASTEICGQMIRNKPIITNVSVLKTDSITGSIYLHWLRPSKLDSINYAPPYKLVLKRSTSKNGIYNGIDSLNYSSFSSITDSSYIDNFINTSRNSYYYKIDFISTNSINPQFIEASTTASSVKATVYSTDRKNILTWSYNVPWVNKEAIIYRKDKIVFDSIGYSTNNTFSDTGLENGKPYLYYIQTIGNYTQIYYPTVLYNNSQEILGIPIDTIRPCAPLLTVTPPCSSFNNFTNLLSWVPDYNCGGDVTYYKIYYKRLKTDSYKLIDSVKKDTLRYIDTRKDLMSSIGGCYVVTGVDSSVNHNESLFTNEVCIDNCPRYEIPNVFTPNGDGYNDLLNPFPYRFVDRINITIFDRWGLPVFQTTELDINWDGKDQNSKNKCTDGVYFIICDVYEIFLDGVKQRTIKSTLHLIR